MSGKRPFGASGKGCTAMYASGKWPETARPGRDSTAPRHRYRGAVRGRGGKGRSPVA
ncbi:hypothetical protein GCM10010512_35830 [Streptomyces thermoviolaceus subsp. thermoviolaceus]|nr:hypothetical protein GCM10010499_37880 [Streptomyces thermoviolaceus subsp. apingens]GHB01183.1 hypothetical protein GCM10010512_35830 [Streptomyces thermoviolaceus subsp. thermoviolaceus]